MKKILILSVMLFVFNPLINFAKARGGGTVVGNGAGKVENNFQFVYQSLGSILTGSLTDSSIELTKKEIDVIRLMLRVVYENKNKSDRLVFVSESTNPGFFNTGVYEQHRIAKTFLRTNAPIYINTDLLYVNHQPALDTDQILRILVHEIGHQVGVADHAVLDILSAKISMFTRKETSSHVYEDESSSKAIVVDLINMKKYFKNFRVLVSSQGNEDFELTDKLFDRFLCKSDSEYLDGSQVTNGHFEVSENGDIRFKAWLKLDCHDTNIESVIKYTRTLIINFDNQYNYQNFEVK